MDQINYTNLPKPEEFDEAVEKQEAFFKSIKVKNGVSVIVEKYQNLWYYSITVVKDGNQVLESYNRLSPYDAYNMMKEVVANYIITTEFNQN